MPFKLRKFTTTAQSAAKIASLNELLTQPTSCTILCWSRLFFLVFGNKNIHCKMRCIFNRPLLHTKTYSSKWVTGICQVTFAQNCSRINKSRITHDTLCTNVFKGDALFLCSFHSSCPPSSADSCAIINFWNCHLNILHIKERMRSQ